MTSQTILVTGAGGLLGRHLVSLLEGAGVEVVAPESAALDLSRPIDPAALPARVDAIVHLAQSRRFRDFPNAASDIFAVNTAAPLALADYSRRAGVTNFVYASSGGVYAPSDMPLTEAAPLADPMGFYPTSKRAAELLLAPFESYFHVAILRYFFIHGPGQSRDMLVPRLVESVREGREIRLQGKDGLRINPVHVADAARATAKAARLELSATINVAGPEVLSLREMGEAIGQAVDREPCFQVDACTSPVSLIADTGEMGRLLGPARERFVESLRDTVS